MRRLLAVLLSLTLLTGVLSGCGSDSTNTNENTASNEKTFTIVTTIFPIYDWVRALLGDRADQMDLTLLLDSGVDLHSFQPTADDIIKISTCDLFIYVGGESDKWVDDALAGAVNKDMVVIQLLDVLGDAVKEEEAVEGMQLEEEGEAEEGPEYDEHVWLSLKNAAVLCQAIAHGLSQMDPEGRDVYKANTAAYFEKLNALDKEYQAAVDAAPMHTVLFGDRFPFRYLVDDYGLEYYAAFVGCSAETEASFETVVFLADKLDQLGLSAVLTLENSDGKIARTIIDNTAHKSAAILTMDSLQSTTAAHIANGATYLSLMEDNLLVLREALQ